MVLNIKPQSLWYLWSGLSWLWSSMLVAQILLTSWYVPTLLASYLTDSRQLYDTCFIFFKHFVLCTSLCIFTVMVLVLGGCYLVWCSPQRLLCFTHLLELLGWLSNKKSSWSLGWLDSLPFVSMNEVHESKTSSILSYSI